MKDLSTEWLQLHQNIEQYERLAVFLKITAFLFTISAMVIKFPWFVATIFVAILWVQEGIIKTFQHRLNQRILLLESAMAPEKTIENQSTDKTTPFQLYSEWNKNKPNAIGLIKQYISNSLKPTVMYPYIILISLYICLLF